MPLPEPAPCGAIDYEPRASIWEPDALPDDVLLVCEYKQLWWRRITEPSTSIMPPSVSRTGWTFLAEDLTARDGVWLLRGVESITQTRRPQPVKAEGAKEG